MWTASRGSFAFWLPVGFGQWEAQARGRRAGRQRGWAIYFPEPRTDCVPRLTAKVCSNVPFLQLFPLGSGTLSLPLSLQPSLLTPGYFTMLWFPLTLLNNPFPKFSLLTCLMEGNICSLLGPQTIQLTAPLLTRFGWTLELGQIENWRKKIKGGSDTSPGHRICPSGDSTAQSASPQQLSGSPAPPTRSPRCCPGSHGSPYPTLAVAWSWEKPWCPSLADVGGGQITQENLLALPHKGLCGLES